MPGGVVLHQNPGMTSLPGAPEAIPVFAVDDHGELAELLGTGSRAAADVVLVQGPLAERLSAESWPSLRVALPPPDGCDDVRFVVDVETVHVADPGKVAQLHELFATTPDAVVVALELVADPDTDPAPDPEEPSDPAARSVNVVCLLFGDVLRICRS